jgi:hypothetical protein
VRGDQLQRCPSPFLLPCSQKCSSIVGTHSPLDLAPCLSVCVCLSAFSPYPTLSFFDTNPSKLLNVSKTSKNSNRNSISP